MLMENLFSSGAPHINFFPSSAIILLVVWSANGDGSALASKSPSSKVNLLNDDAYATIIVLPFGQIEQGVH